jgi:hypothetical protein
MSGKLDRREKLTCFSLCDPLPGVPRDSENDFKQTVLERRWLVAAGVGPYDAPASGRSPGALTPGSGWPDAAPDHGPEWPWVPSSRRTSR